MKKTNRVFFIDIARGIAILLMIGGHVLGYGIKRDIIFSFHMPLFIIVSGYFYKDKPLKEHLKYLLLHLLIPSFLIIFVVNMIMNIPDIGFIQSLLISFKTVITGWSHQANITYNFPSVGILWFIYFLIIMKLLFIITKKISKDNDILLLLLILLESFIGYFIGVKGCFLPWSIDISFACIILYYFGYIIHKYDVLNKIISNNYMMILLLILWIIGIICNPIEIAMRSYPNGLWSFISAISGSLVVFKLSSLIEKYLKNTSKILGWCGKYSLYILLINYIESKFIKYNFYLYNPSVTKISIILIRWIIVLLCTFIVVKIIDIIHNKKTNNL